MGETASYITCANGHNVFVFRMHSGNFLFTCEQACAPADIAVSIRAFTRSGMIEIKMQEAKSA